MAAFYSLKSRIFATIFILASVLLGLVYWQLQAALEELLEEEVRAQEQVMLQMLREPALHVLQTHDYGVMQPLLQSLHGDQRVVAVLLADGQGRVVVASRAQDMGRQFGDVKTTDPAARWSLSELARGPVKLGTLALEFSRQPLETAQEDARQLAMAIAAACMILITLAGLGTAWLLTRRLERLRVAAEKIAAGDLNVRIGLRGYDEAAGLSRAFDLMTRRVAENQYALMHLNAVLERRVQERTAELSRVIADMRQVQEHLVQTEKMAALGSLVAGVSHEINTPLGISVTAATYVEELLKSLDESIRSGNLSQSSLHDFMARTSEANAMVLSNLQRAAELMRNFKMVAVDQASAKRREFMLLETLQEIVSTLRPLLKTRGIVLALDVPDGIVMDSYPGALGQVITNLFSNALLHGFEGRATGSIDIKARAYSDGSVAVYFSDDGVGIAVGNVGRIFDPFFTTKAGEGGSGLGLHIVYNIVTGLLGGQITVDSRPGQGATFTITMPRVSPRAGSDSPGPYIAPTAVQT